MPNGAPRSLPSLNRYGPDVLLRLRDILAARPGLVWSGRTRRQAAVLVPLFVDEGDVRVLLAKRTSHMRRHPGEVAFPGGGLDPGDASLQGAALREAWEEVRLEPRSVDILGRLDDMPTAGSGYVIRPYVSGIPGADGLVPDGVEVERLLTPALSLFADPTRRREEIRERDGFAWPVIYFDVGEDVVWGATARIIDSLIALLDGRDPAPIPDIPIP